jgi:hypothetical protein
MSGPLGRQAGHIGAAAVALALLHGCSESDESLDFSVLETCVQLRQPATEVFRSAQAWQDFYRSSGAGQPPAVDFSRFLVAARFEGTGSACVGFTVEEVVADENGVVVHATRHESPGPCIAVLAFPQLVVAVEVRDLPVEFDVSSVRDEPPAQPRPCF